MQPQLVAKDGSTIPLTEEQYQQIVLALRLAENSQRNAPSEAEVDALLDELQGISASQGFSTTDLLDERRREQKLG